MQTRHMVMCVLLIAGCTDELGVAESASSSPDDETKLACPSGPHDITSHGRWDWGRVEADLGPYEDAITAKREADATCKERVKEAVKLTDDAAIRECKAALALVGCGPGPQERTCERKLTDTNECEVVARSGGTPDLGDPFKGISGSYWVKCRYSATARARGKTKLSCVLR